MEQHHVLRLLEELAEGGTFSVGLSGGEPLLLPWSFNIIDHAKKLGLIVGIGTNGSTIDRETAARLAVSGVDHVQVSVDGIGQTHDWFRGVQGLFAKAVRAIELLVRSGLKVNVCMTVCAVNMDEFDQVVSLAWNLGAAEFNLSQFVPLGRGNALLDMEPLQWKAIMERFHRLKQKYPDMKFTCHEAQLVLVEPQVRNMPIFKGCQAGSGVACIKSDGSILPCVMLDLPVGNIKEGSFRGVWETSRVLAELRERSAVQGRCGKCEDAAWCGGCRGVAYAYTGNHLAEDPRCWSGL